jgi:hypothetical protein
LFDPDNEYGSGSRHQFDSGTTLSFTKLIFLCCTGDAIEIEDDAGLEEAANLEIPVPVASKRCSSCMREATSRKAYMSLKKVSETSSVSDPDSNCCLDPDTNLVSNHGKLRYKKHYFGSA